MEKHASLADWILPARQGRLLLAGLAGLAGLPTGSDGVYRNDTLDTLDTLVRGGESPDESDRLISWRRNRTDGWMKS